MPVPSYKRRIAFADYNLFSVAKCNICTSYFKLVISLNERFMAQDQSTATDVCIQIVAYLNMFYSFTADK